MRWVSDAPSPSDPPGTPPSAWRQEPAIKDDRWWDFQSAAAAANRLLDDLPRMLRHWDRLRWAPETRDGFEKIKALGDALSLALPYIEFPLGKYERATHHTRSRPKPWHIPALVIANIVVEALIKSGAHSPRTTRNSTVVRIVRAAFVRMDYQNIGMITTDAIGAYLTRRSAKFGNFGTAT
jgi:hypothetical protein